MIVRENIYAALFNLLSGLTGFVTTSRVPRLWADVAPASQPALFLTQVSEEAVLERRVPVKWLLRVDITIYVNTTGDSAQVPIQMLNPLIDSVINALAAPAGPVGEQTLGGLVEYCRVVGTIETDGGALAYQNQGVAIIPVEILTTS